MSEVRYMAGTLGHVSVLTSGAGEDGVTRGTRVFGANPSSNSVLGELTILCVCVFLGQFIPLGG